MPKTDWRPSAELALLKQRAQLYQQLRAFFLARDVLEVEVPILGRAATVDPFIDSLSTECRGVAYYLQTSPEFFLKRLLAAGSGSVYAMGKAFRAGEQGRRHHREFTLLEWYRLDWDERQLMAEVAALIQQLLPELRVSYFSYRQVFQDYLGIDPHRAAQDQLKQLARAHTQIRWDDAERDTWLDILMTHVIEPKLPRHLVFIYNYPASQAALAQVAKDDQGQLVARRFEAYLQGVELANGYFELRDAAEQQRRFQRDQQQRDQQGAHKGRQPLPYDHKLIAALEHGLPACAGVALGIDRLLMLLSGADSLHQVISFCE
ncbi:MAG: EF-P lysine aminoacylase GenX [Cellvibrionaceae bacterium]|nr:EF-P lysine aminoacylase GenX [Cellvibrionaceae bacterium]